jgi:diguanylate cyclase (GGDEF)-like protein
LVTSIASRWLNLRGSVSSAGEKVLIVGTGEGFSLANRLLHQGEFQYIFSIVGVVDDENLSMQGMKIEGCKILGKTSDLPRIVEEKEIGLIVFTNPHVPATIQKYVKKLWKKSKIKLLYLDNIPRIFHEQLSQSFSPEVSSIWPQDLPKYQALHDVVTGLPNRFLFQDRLIQSFAFAQRYNTQPLAMFVKIDQIIPLDGSHKQFTWEQVIQQISQRLQGIKRESDTLAYLGEQEFAFIFENIQNESAIPSISKRIINTLTNKLEIDGQKITVHASLSICANYEELMGVRLAEMNGELLDTLLERSVIATS